jgi:hypothetical protein
MKREYGVGKDDVALCDIKYEGRPESKDRLRIALAQANTPRRFRVARSQSSVGFVPSKFSTDCII